ncbi:MAG: diguanylate cyclase [Pseudomonadota bacterium]
MHIVIADSSRVGLEILKRMLKERGDTVDTFTDGLKAYRFLVAEQNIDVLLTGFELTSMSGLELCWEARLLAQTRNPIYVIAMSSTHDNDKLVQALDSGADDFIRKPPSHEELFARFRAAERLNMMQKELVHLANIDPLTGVFNRRAFFEKAHKIMDGLQPEQNFSSLMFDIDHFKKVNDTYGHDIGDEAIRKVAEQAGVENAIVGRLGGEEFAVLLSGYSSAQAFDIAETIRNGIAALSIKTNQGILKMTCSFGVSEYRDNETIDDMLKRADIALYQAKHNGRNRVIMFDENRLRLVQ